jgi:MFS transporter, OFA family, oxalate/formate antiporter
MCAVTKPLKNHGVRVTAAATAVNFSLGIVYTWTVFSKNIPDEWGWSETHKSWPYSVTCLVFSLMMVLAGRLQDRMGPRLVASVGGLLVGLGLMLASQTTTFWGYALGFGIVAGTGIGFGYASTTPPAVKWFPAARTGMIAGIVVAGSSLSGVWIPPLAKIIIVAYGVPVAVFTLGIAVMVLVVLLAQLLVSPPENYVPVESDKLRVKDRKEEDFGPKEMLLTSQFYMLWVMFASAGGAGLMIISKLAQIGAEQADFQQGAVLAIAMAVGSCTGRVACGWLSDKLGRRNTMVGVFVFQAGLILILSMVHADSIFARVSLFVPLTILLGINYGGCVALCPAITKDYYGLKHFGANYGLVFTSWGIGGFALPLLAGLLHDRYGSFIYAYYAAIGLLALAVSLTCLIAPPNVSRRRPIEDLLNSVADRDIQSSVNV